MIVDFTNVPVGTEIILQNLGPDEPFGGGVPGVDFDPADPGSTGQVMQFRVKAATRPRHIHIADRLASSPSSRPSRHDPHRVPQ